MALYNSIDELIGGTPLLRLSKFEKKHNLAAAVYAKLEFFNPAGSVKDRTAKAMLDGCFSAESVKTVIVEPTSGNTGIAIASLAAARGCNAVLVMPENMSAERVRILKAYGAEVILTPAEKGMKCAVERAEAIRAARGGVTLGQFTNAANPLAHARSTAPEIWEDLRGGVDIFVAGVGTGGTLTGVGKFLKEKNPNIKVVAVGPESTPHAIQGIGAGFEPEILDKKIIDEDMRVSDGEAKAFARGFARCEGLLVGFSSGAALCAAAKIASRAENFGKNVVTVLPDGGERYLSSDLFG